MKTKKWSKSKAWSQANHLIRQYTQKGDFAYFYIPTHEKLPVSRMAAIPPTKIKRAINDCVDKDNAYLAKMQKNGINPFTPHYLNRLNPAGEIIIVTSEITDPDNEKKLLQKWWINREKYCSLVSDYRIKINEKQTVSKRKLGEAGQLNHFEQISKRTANTYEPGFAQVLLLAMQIISKSKGTSENLTKLKNMLLPKGPIYKWARKCHGRHILFDGVSLSIYESSISQWASKLRRYLIEVIFAYRNKTKVRSKTNGEDRKLIREEIQKNYSLLLNENKAFISINNDLIELSGIKT